MKKIAKEFHLLVVCDNSSVCLYDQKRLVVCGGLLNTNSVPALQKDCEYFGMTIEKGFLDAHYARLTQHWISLLDPLMFYTLPQLPAIIFPSEWYMFRGSNLKTTETLQDYFNLEWNLAVGALFGFDVHHDIEGIKLYEGGLWVGTLIHHSNAIELKMLFPLGAKGVMYHFLNKECSECFDPLLKGVEYTLMNGEA